MNTPKIPEPTLSWSLHGAQFGGLRVFPVIKIIVVRQVHVLPPCTAVWTWRQTCVKPCAANENREHICFAFVFACVVSKNPKTPILSSMADNAITRGGIQEVWYLWCISVVISQKIYEKSVFLQDNAHHWKGDLYYKISQDFYVISWEICWKVTYRTFPVSTGLFACKRG